PSLSAPPGYRRAVSLIGGIDTGAAPAKIHVATVRREPHIAGCGADEVGTAHDVLDGELEALRLTNRRCEGKTTRKTYRDGVEKKRRGTTSHESTPEGRGRANVRRSGGLHQHAAAVARRDDVHRATVGRARPHRLAVERGARRHGDRALGPNPPGGGTRRPRRGDHSRPVPRSAHPCGPRVAAVPVRREPVRPRRPAR